MFSQFAFISACGSNPMAIGGKVGTFGINDIQQNETRPTCSWIVQAERNHVSIENKHYVINPAKA